MASFSQNEIGVAVAVQIADADARGGFPFRFEQQYAIKRARRDGGQTAGPAVWDLSVSRLGRIARGRGEQQTK